MRQHADTFRREAHRMVDWIADYLGQVVRRVELDGTIVTVAGNGTAGFAGDGDFLMTVQELAMAVQYGLDAETGTEAYFLAEQAAEIYGFTSRSMNVVVEAEGNPLSIVPDIRRTVRSAIRAGGEPIERHHLAPTPRLRRLVLLLDGLLDTAELERALEYIRVHEEIWEVNLEARDGTCYEVASGLLRPAD